MKNIHILKTNKPSRLFLNKINNKLLFLKNETRIDTASIGQYQHIYITSDEEIKEERLRWIVDNRNGMNGFIHQVSVILDSNICPEIILTTDQDLISEGVQAIDDEFLEWFVKNSSCERVEIRYTVDFNSKAVIIIPKEEPKQVTLEEVAEEYAISKSSSSVFQKAHIRDFIAGAKWQQERMYSEEEVKEILTKCTWILTESKLKWFEQFKKK